MRTLPVLLVVLLSLPLFAQHPNNELELGFGWARYAENVGETSRDTAATFSYNRFWSPTISTRFGLTEHGIGLTIGGDTGSDISAKTFLVEYHPRRGQRVSPYGGAGVGYVEAEAGAGRHITVHADGELAPLLKIGADLNLARWFAVGLDGTYMRYAPEFSDGRTRDISPAMLSASMKFRF
jgi:opacity protein-like surface antigen